MGGNIYNFLNVLFFSFCFLISWHSLPWHAQEARRIIADRRERNRKALPGKTVETRFYSGITPHDCEKLVADAYQNLQGDFWQPDDLKQHLRKVLVLNCNIEPDSASSALGMVVDVSQDSIQMPLPSKPVY